MYRNPIPCLPEDTKYKKFRIEFSYEEAMTVEEAAHEFYKFLLDKEELPKEFIAPNGKPVIEHQNSEKEISNMLGGTSRILNLEYGEIPNSR